VVIAAKMIAMEIAEENKQDVHPYDCPPSSVKQFLKLRREMNENSMDDNDPMMFLVEHMFGQAHGLRNWRSAKGFQRISQVLTVSDEAFVLLSIENGWDAIQKDIDDNEDEGHTKRNVYARGKYTNHGTNLRYGGWSPEGIERFNELYDMVEKNRKEPWAKKVEEEITKKLLRRHHGTTDTTKVRKKRKHNGSQGQQEVEDQVVQVKARSSLGNTVNTDIVGV
jgi:hypothetical protein